MCTSGVPLNLKARVESRSMLAEAASKTRTPNTSAAQLPSTNSRARASCSSAVGAVEKFRMPTWSAAFGV